MSLIALEEHFAWDPASEGNVVGTWLRTNNPVGYERLYDRGPLRLEQMDAAGIDFQILSLFDPGVQEMADTARAIELARGANDSLAETVRANPNRFGGFATLATQDPDAAAAEFERAVTELGLVGGLINGHCQGRYLDDPAYEGLFACAESLDAPVYLHPTTPHPAVMDAWFAPYVDDGLHLASWGFAAEAGTHVLRLIYSGLFDKFPRLQMIIGHLGEMLPFAAYRVDRYYGLGGNASAQRHTAPALGLPAQQLSRHDKRQLLPAGLRLHARGDGGRPGDVLGGLPDGRQPGRRRIPGVLSDGRRYAQDGQLRERDKALR